MVWLMHIFVFVDVRRCYNIQGGSTDKYGEDNLRDGEKVSFHTDEVF